MGILVALVIMLTVYIIKNNNMQESSKTGYFITLAVVGVLVLLCALLF